MTRWSAQESPHEPGPDFHPPPAMALESIEPEITGRAVTIMGLLVNEIRTQSGHFGGYLQEALGDEVHDSRMRGDGGCYICRLLTLADDVMGKRRDDLPASAGSGGVDVG